MFSFGFNAFQQTNPNDKALKTTLSQKIGQILINIQIDDERLEIWGFKPAINLEEWQTKKPTCIFGDPNEILGLVDENKNAWYCYGFSGESMPLRQLAVNVKKAVYCQGRQAIYVLTECGKVTCYTGLKDNLVHSIMDIPNRVHDIAASFSHILFYSAGYDPIYALGSNRFSQLGLDYQQSTNIEMPFPIDFFCGLGNPYGTTDGSVSCSPFHSVVILSGEVYTFGLRKDGRLGWGEEEADDCDDSTVGLGVFMENGVEVQVNAIKSVCGSSHTVVLDDNYGQLGHPNIGTINNVFCQWIPSTKSKAIDCCAGRWNTFILTDQSREYI
ncbi:regulator of chromosome condensation 1/beta-lactamase-inhibitor protein II [Phycomyces blakesleeanus]